MIEDKTFMKIAETIAKESYCKRRQVGAIIVKNNSIISVGYNGTPSGFENNCEERVEFADGNEKIFHSVERTKPEVLHAEANAILKCARSEQNSNGADIYVTTAPCLECSKLIIQAGIKQVFYKDNYKTNAGLKLLKKAKISVKQLDYESETEKEKG